MQGWSDDRSAITCAPCLAVFASTYVIYSHSLRCIPPLLFPVSCACAVDPGTSCAVGQVAKGVQRVEAVLRVQLFLDRREAIEVAAPVEAIEVARTAVGYKPAPVVEAGAREECVRLAIIVEGVLASLLRVTIRNNHMVFDDGANQPEAGQGNFECFF